MKHLLVLVLALSGIAASVHAAGGVVNISTPSKEEKPPRKAPASLASLPAPQALGPLRILLVDDDASPNNTAGMAQKGRGSDDIYRELAASAVGGKADAWAVEVVKPRANGPAFERLREFNVVLWYTGAEYGADTDTIGREDEKTLRRYLEETGGCVILISPGYVNNLVYGQSWEAAEHPFLREVMGVNGCYGLAQRFAAGTVAAHDGAQFHVADPGAVETQFSVVNSDGAAIVFTSPIKTSDVQQRGGLPVAVANPFGRGRLVYVGFTFENIPDSERTKAFGLLLSATGTGVRASAVATTTTPTAPSTPSTTRPVAATPVGQGSGVQKIKQAPPGPAVASLAVQGEHPGRHLLSWTLPAEAGAPSYEIYRRDSGNWTKLENPAVGNGSTPGTFSFIDRALVAPNSAYLVGTVYADGRRGETRVEYANPPQPITPTILEIVQTGQFLFRVTWRNEGWEKFRVLWPNQTNTSGQPDPDGIRMDEPGYGLRYHTYPDGVSELEFPNATPTASYTYSFAADYGSDGVVVMGPKSTPATITVRTFTGRYRVVCMGMKLNYAVDDDILNGDGKGNELFANVMIVSSPGPRDPATIIGHAETMVYGDNANRPDRLRAGSAGAAGGLRQGDFVPGMDILGPQPGLVGLNDRFPLKIWEGELGGSNPRIAIVPVVIEWNANNHATLGNWRGFWGGPQPRLQISAAMEEAIFANLNKPLTAQPLYGTWKVDDNGKRYDDPTLEQRPNVPHHTPEAGVDRIVGLMHAAPPVAFQIPVYGHDTRGLVLSYASVEASIPAASSIYQVQCISGDTIGGSVSCYFQIERLTPSLVFPPQHHTPGPVKPRKTLPGRLNE